jgi:hypothetical protein
MGKTKSGNIGIRLLIKTAKRKFRIPENLNHYSDRDFKQAEKKFLKVCVLGGRC